MREEVHKIIVLAYLLQKGLEGDVKKSTIFLRIFHLNLKLQYQRKLKYK